MYQTKVEKSIIRRGAHALQVKSKSGILISNARCWAGLGGANGGGIGEEKQRDRDVVRGSQEGDTSHQGRSRRPCDHDLQAVS